LWATHNLEGWSQHARRPVLADGQPDDTRCTGGKGEETTPQQTKHHIDERSNEQTRTNKQTTIHTAKRQRDNNNKKNNKPSVMFRPADRPTE
jgi:hypothetical protein